ncbi:MAG: hypothetical protein JWO78_2472 [Micavibrio sp.]|nr:hypothetical protein [Micavibrio sp.]
MTATLPPLSESFENAGKTPDPEMLARYVIAAFTRNTLGTAFDIDQFQVSLSRPGDFGQYAMEIEFLPEASDQNKYNLNEFGHTLAEALVAIEHDMEEGSHEPCALKIALTDQGFVLLTPELRDFTALFAYVSELHELHLKDPKYCAEIGHEYSLADIEQAIALIPEGEDEEAPFQMDRPVDMGLPKPWLQ